MSSEYALMKSNQIITVVSSSRDIEDLRRHYPDYLVDLLDRVPDQIRKAYQYWNERP